jgi:hypothetical protein
MPKYNKPYCNSYGEFIFDDFPEFIPNMSPREIIENGSFGGGYFREIYSSVINKTLKNDWKRFPKEIFKGIPKEYYLTLKYDKKINKYDVRVGTSLEFWEEKDWITKYDPRGWFAWYCNFFYGRRTQDDERQIYRWLKTAGPNSRFRKWLFNLLNKNDANHNDWYISPKIFQTLQHWSYVPTKKDYINYLYN